jgi:multidrug resistance efflux pump
MTIDTEACDKAAATTIEKDTELREALGRLVTARFVLDARRKHSAQAVDAASVAAKAVIEARSEVNAAALKLGNAMRHLRDGEVLAYRSGYFVPDFDSNGERTARILMPVTVLELVERLEEAEAAKGGVA